MPDDADRMRTRFDEIVEGLELELPADLTPSEPVSKPEPARPAHPELEESADFDSLPDDQFYRDVHDVRLPAMAWPTTIAWVATVGVPALLVVCTLIGVFLPRGMVLGAGFIAVAGATYLFSRIPSRGRPDSPGDGAVL